VQSPTTSNPWRLKMKISEIQWEPWMKPEKENGYSPENLKENTPITGIIPAISFLLFSLGFLL